MPAPTPNLTHPPTNALRTAARVDAVPPSGIRRFFDIAATMPEVISLGIGEPDFVTPAPILRAGIASIEAGHTGYTSNSGLIELRVALAEHLATRYGVRYDPETEILITVGGSEALHIAALALVDGGDEVLVPEPCFVAYPAVVTFAGGTPVPVATHVENDFQLDVADLAAATTARTRGMLIGYPSNPTGAVMDRPRLEAVAAFAAQRDLFVISDEIYDQLVYGMTHTCMASLPGMRERTVLLGGFSKSYAMTGWRIGYACAPAPMIAALRKIHQYIIMSAPTAGQYAALAALTDPAAAAAVQDMRAAYDARRRLVVDGFNAIGLSTFEPRGAFYAFPDIRASGLDGDTFCERLLYEHKVALVPGHAFGEAGRGFARCSYAASLPRLTEALERVGAFMATL
ncbi:MAG: aminotransferase class I/II-fold pyridoxal phosphate-dependent enzyme [Ardenticatenales bacterium]